MISLLTVALLASTPITLNEARDLSRKNTQALLSELEAARAGQGVRTAKSGIYPQVTLNGGANYTATGPQRIFSTVPTRDAAGNVAYEQRVVDVEGSGRGGFDLSVSVSQLLYDGGKWWSRIAQAGAQEDAARGQAIEQQLTSEFEGVRRFYELYRAQERATVLEANKKRSEDQVARAQGLFEAGRTGKGDWLAARVNLGNDQITLIQQQNRIASTQADLAAWIAHPASEDLFASRPALQPDAAVISLSDGIAKARENRPLYRSLEAQLRAADLAVQIARADYLPKVSAQLSAGHQGPTADPFFTDPTKQNYVNGGINIRWDLFNGFATNSAAETATLQRNTADLNLQQALRELEGEVKKAITAVTVQQEATKIAMANRELAAEGLKVAEGRFQSGAGSTLEVRDAQLKLTQSELTLLETQIDTEIARANLERVLGTGAMR